MANKRDLKHAINEICEELFAECMAAMLYGPHDFKPNQEALLHAIARLQGHYLSRVCHVEPGMSARGYFHDLKKKFNADVNDIVGQINNI
jgi:hypothetical protein